MITVRSIPVSIRPVSRSTLWVTVMKMDRKKKRLSTLSVRDRFPASTWTRTTRLSCRLRTRRVCGNMSISLSLLTRCLTATPSCSKITVRVPTAETSCWTMCRSLCVSPTLRCRWCPHFAAMRYPMSRVPLTSRASCPQQVWRKWKVRVTNVIGNFVATIAS